MGGKSINMKLPQHPLFDELKKLNISMGEYAVFGSGPLWIRGIRESNDEDIPFVSLEAVIQWKKRMGREKDMRDLALIDEYLKKKSI